VHTLVRVVHVVRTVGARLVGDLRSCCVRPGPVGEDLVLVGVPEIDEGGGEDRVTAVPGSVGPGPGSPVGPGRVRPVVRFGKAGVRNGIENTARHGPGVRSAFRDVCRGLRSHQLQAAAVDRRFQELAEPAPWCGIHPQEAGQQATEIVDVLRRARAVLPSSCEAAQNRSAVVGHQHMATVDPTVGGVAAVEVLQGPGQGGNQAGDLLGGTVPTVQWRAHEAGVQFGAGVGDAVVDERHHPRVGMGLEQVGLVP
jgi:hypothetical protein